MKITIDLNKPLVDLDEKPVPDGVSLGKSVAFFLASANAGNAIKFYDWALAFHKNEPVEVDLADYNALYNFVEQSTSMTNIAKAQVLMLLMAAKENASKLPA